MHGSKPVLPKGYLATWPLCDLRGDKSSNLQKFKLGEIEVVKSEAISKHLGYTFYYKNIKRFVGQTYIKKNTVQ